MQREETWGTGKVHAYLIYEQTLLKKAARKAYWQATRLGVNGHAWKREPAVILTYRLQTELHTKKNQHNYHHEFNLVFLNYRNTQHFVIVAFLSYLLFFMETDWQFFQDASQFDCKAWHDIDIDIDLSINSGVF